MKQDRGIRHRVIGLVEREVQAGRISAVDIGRCVGRRLREAEEQGDVEAGLIVTFAAQQYATHIAEEILRNLGTTRVSWNGTQVTLPERFSVSVRNPQGQTTKERQYPLWLELPEADLYALRDSLSVKSVSLAHDVAAIDRILHLIREQNATTGLEACQKAGIDPQDIAL